MKSRPINPDSLAAPVGYSHGLLVEEHGKLLFLGGQVGWDGTGRLASGFVAQFEQALDNLLAVVAEAGGSPESVVKMTVFVRDKNEYLGCTKELGRVWRGRMQRHYPAMALVEVSALLEEGALVEIEGMAVL